MVATADDPERIDLALRSIAAMQDDLADVSAEWESLPADERVGWSLVWGNEMVKLRQLADAVVAGRLDARRAAEIYRLAERAVAQTETLKCLELRLPADVVLGLGQARV